MPVDPWHVGVAGLPLAFLLVVLLGLRWPGPRAGVAGEALSRLTEDHILQLLIIGFAFTSFLQGVEGFGVPVAVTAPLLLGLGFRPLEAAAVPLVAPSSAAGVGALAPARQR